MIHQNVSAAPASSASPACGNAASEWLLAELRGAHHNLLLAMETMDDATRMAVPDRDCYPNARWRLSQASLRRRALWGNIFQHLLPRAGPTAAEALKSHGLVHRDMLCISAAHVGRWTMASIEEDWRGYCGASRTLRWQMSASISAEKRIVYPLLEQDARGGRR